MTRNEDRTEKRQRLIEAAMAVLQSAPGKRLNIVLLNKALFYLDLMALRDFGQTVTRAPYVALKAGPVVAKYDERLLSALELEGLAHQEEERVQAPLSYTAKPVVVDRDLDRFEYLSSEEVGYAQEAGRWIAEDTSSGRSLLSHDNIGWKVAWEEGLGKGYGGPKTIDMRLALQQVMDVDPWLDEPPSDALRDAVDEADRGAGEPL